MMWLLQFPRVVLALPPDEYEFDEALPGADVLLRLICYCDENVDITTARLVERFRDTPYHARLAELAAKAPLPPEVELDLDVATTEFSDCIVKLRNLSDRRRRAPALGSLGAARLGLISINRS